MDVIPAGPMRRRWSAEAKARIIQEAMRRTKSEPRTWKRTK
jgi:transposase-like protein